MNHWPALTGITIFSPSRTTLLSGLGEVVEAHIAHEHADRFGPSLWVDAARIAYRELVNWLVADYGFDVYEAYFLLTQAGRVRVGNMVDPKYTLGASILKRYLPAKA
jgi:acetamidase/formamidase